MDQSTADAIDSLINDASAQGIAWYATVTQKPITPTSASLVTGQPLQNFVPVAVAPPAFSLTGPNGFLGSIGSSSTGLLLVAAVLVGVVLIVK